MLITGAEFILDNLFCLLFLRIPPLFGIPHLRSCKICMSHSWYRSLILFWTCFFAWLIVSRNSSTSLTFSDLFCLRKLANACCLSWVDSGMLRMQRYRPPIFPENALGDFVLWWNCFEIRTVPLSLVFYSWAFIWIDVRRTEFLRILNLVDETYRLFCVVPEFLKNMTCPLKLVHLLKCCREVFLVSTLKCLKWPFAHLRLL